METKSLTSSPYRLEISDPYTRILITSNAAERLEFELLAFIWLHQYDVQGSEDKTTVFCAVAIEDLPRVCEFARKTGVSVQKYNADRSALTTVVLGDRGQLWDGDEEGGGW